MTIRYDDKGKIFTDIISKEAVRVLIQTSTNRIYGDVYVRQGERLKDEVNRLEAFLAVTSAQVCDLAGQELFSAGFLLVQRDAIIWVAPEDEIGPAGLPDQDAQDENERGAQ